MEIPFTTNEFLNVFKSYNEGVFPAQFIAYLLGIIAVRYLYTRTKTADIIINGVLASFWIWMGIVYHFIYFSSINEAAIIFGTAFIIQGLLFLIFGVFKGQITYSLSFSKFNLHQTLSIVLIIYAMIIYPVLNQLLGHSYPHSPIFGLAPCPTVIFTFGILLLSVKKLPFYLVIIPFLWSLVGFSAAIHLGMIEDYGLVIAGIVALIFILKRKASSPLSTN